MRVSLVALTVLAVASCGSSDDPPADAGATDAATGGSSASFSFFVTSLEAMRELSGSANGFGGNLGGLEGADSICQRTAAKVGAGGKTWRAFLSATKGGPDGGPVHAIERIGNGPWYDRYGRVVAMDRAGLLSPRPAGDPQIASDLPNERGEGLRRMGDTHDVLTGSNRMGMLNATDPASTCHDWTSATAAGTENKVMCGHAWPRSVTSGHQWIADHAVPGCAAGVNLMVSGGGATGCVGCAGGYGAIYCFALSP